MVANPEQDETSLRASGDGNPSVRSGESVTIYDASPDLSRPMAVVGQIARGFFDGRELAWRLFLRNLRGMYRQTLLGIFWLFLPPIANTAIWVFLKSQNVFQFELDNGISTTLYILTGMVLWQSFIEAFQMPIDSLNKNRAMISKLNFPREALILDGMADLLFNLLVRMLILVPAFFLFGMSVSPVAWIAGLALALLMILFGIGAGLILAPVGSLYQDVSRFINLATPFWMIVTPIIYIAPVDYPGNLLNWLNPASPLLVAARDLLVIGGTVHGTPALVYGLLTLPLLFVGLVVWRVSIPSLVERMPA